MDINKFLMLILLFLQPLLLVEATETSYLTLPKIQAGEK